MSHSETGKKEERREGKKKTEGETKQRQMK